MSKSNSFLKLAFIVAVFFSVRFSDVSAQSCPTSIAPTNISWIGPNFGSVQIPGTNCWIDFHSCYQTVNSVTEYYISDWGPNPTNWGSECSSINWADMLNIVRKKLFKGTGKPPCSGSGSGTQTVRIFSGTCLSFTSGSYPTAFSCAGEQFCKTECTLCDAGGGNTTESNCSTSVVGSSNSCSTLTDFSSLNFGAVLNNTWGYSYSTCYFVDCTNY
ncbi:MAG: hypothetical protein WCH46_09190 [bacterium]